MLLDLQTLLRLLDLTLFPHRDDQFKGNAGNSDTPKLDKPKVLKPPAAVAAMPNSSHLDAVPQPTPINRNRWVFSIAAFACTFYLVGFCTRR